MLTAEQYQQKKALLADTSKNFSPEARAKVEGLIKQYESISAVAPGEGVQDEDDAFLARGKYANEPPLAPGEPGRVLGQHGQAGAPGTDEARVQQVISSLDPSMPIVPQGLSLSPATTHPAGDEVAQDEWLRGELNNPNGVVIVYDAPVAMARKELLENPQIYTLLGGGFAIPENREEVMNIPQGGYIHQAYNDYKWREAADAAAKVGKTAYRNSKAPFLADGKGGDLLARMKLDMKAGQGPQDEQIAAFVLGYDQVGNFGLGQAAHEIVADPLKSALGGTPDKEPGQYETVGGIPEDLPARERNDIAQEEHPVMHMLGQGVGALAPWTLANKVWGAIVGSGAAKGVGGVAKTTLRTGAAGATHEALSEGVRAGSNLVQTGDTGTSLSEAGGRIAGTGLASAGVGMLASAVPAASRAIGEDVRWGPRYKGAPGRAEAQGVEVKPFRGHVPPQVVSDAEAAGRLQGGRMPLQVLARELDEPLSDATRFREQDVARIGEANRAEHYASGEGKHELQMSNLVRVAIERIKALTSQVGKKGMQPVGAPGVGNEVAGILNKNIEGVSARKTKTGIPMKARDAMGCLHPSLTSKIDLEKIAKKDGVVYLTPRRYDSAHTDQVIEELSHTTDPDVADIYEAALMDRQGRSWSGEKGAWSRLSDEQAKAEEAAADVSRRVRAHTPGGTEKAVIEAGKSKGQSTDLPALKEAAHRAGGDAPEKLRGALVADDLAKISEYGRVGSRSPSGMPRGLMGLSALYDLWMLRGLYPMTRKLEPLTGKTPAKLLQGRGARQESEERSEERTKKTAEGYEERAKEAGAGKPPPRRRGKERKPVRRRRETVASED